LTPRRDSSRRLFLLYLSLNLRRLRSPEGAAFSRIVAQAVPPLPFLEPRPLAFAAGRGVASCIVT
jgi:hypothetical protein